MVYLDKYGQPFDSKEDEYSSWRRDQRQKTQDAIDQAGLREEYDAAIKQHLALVTSQQIKLDAINATSRKEHKSKSLQIIEKYRPLFAEATRKISDICTRARNWKNEAIVRKVRSKWGFSDSET